MERSRNQYTTMTTPQEFVTDFLANRVLSIGGAHNT